MSENEVEELLARLALVWRGGQDDVLRRNCTHFCDEFCRHLGVEPCPDWVGNIAIAGRTVDLGLQRVASFRSASFCENPQHVSPNSKFTNKRNSATRRGR